jgi:hypothetical protein
MIFGFKAGSILTTASKAVTPAKTGVQCFYKLFNLSPIIVLDITAKLLYTLAP